MNKISIIIIFFIVVVGAAAAFRFSHRISGTAETVRPAGDLKSAGSDPVVSGSADIRMTDNGFVPDAITIRRGTPVHFINSDTVWHWPASDLHPTHNLYPQFDPKKAVGPGETWTFTFERVGTWPFHDHLAPYNTGKITVIE